MAQEVEEEVLEAAECARIGPSTAELLAVSLPRMANCRLKPLPSSPDTPFLPKVLPHSRHNLVRRDAVFPNPQLPILLHAPITTLTTVTTNAPSAPARFFATPKFGHATLAGLSSICPASRSGLKTKDPPLPSNKVERTARSPLPANGDVQDAIFRKTRCPRRTLVGVRKRSNLVQSLAYHHILVEILVVEKEFASVLILVN